MPIVQISYLILGVCRTFSMASPVSEIFNLGLNGIWISADTIA